MCLFHKKMFLMFWGSRAGSRYETYNVMTKMRVWEAKCVWAREHCCLTKDSNQQPLDPVLYASVCIPAVCCIDRLFKIKRRYRDVLGTLFVLFQRLMSLVIVIVLVYYFFAIIGMEVFLGMDLRNCCKWVLLGIGISPLEWLIKNAVKLYSNYLSYPCICGLK